MQLIYSLHNYTVMSLGYFSYPLPENEPVLNYAAGSAEKIILKKTLAELKKETADIHRDRGSKEELVKKWLSAHRTKSVTCWDIFMRETKSMYNRL